MPCIAAMAILLFCADAAPHLLRCASLQSTALQSMVKQCDARYDLLCLVHRLARTPIRHLGSSSWNRIFSSPVEGTSYLRVDSSRVDAMDAVNTSTEGLMRRLQHDNIKRELKAKVSARCLPRPRIKTSMRCSSSNRALCLLTSMQREF